ncbi:hypothetical protein [Paracoccus pacificus]|uniref:Uncharacterized protein n=1 Tax=Paracoccus pacificus TaxID=1463598 RepID=A0ABW4RB48_9RHOB
MAKYTPPVQSRAGQIIDVIVLLVLALGALYVPLWLGLAGSAKVDTPVPDPTWETLGQNATMAERWQQLGFATPADAAPIITSRFNYAFSWFELIVMAIVIIGYFVMMLRLSDKEYREVVDARFGDREKR